MKEIIPAVNRGLLISELTEDKLLRKTNYGDNYLYVFTYHDSPNLMREIGRLREIAFRAAGGGTGKDCDIDKYDTADKPYKQLIVWDDKDKEILGGYRFINCGDFLKETCDANFNLATTGLFEFSEKFKTDYLPYTIELGRSFVQPEFQANKLSRKTLFALDNLWDGLGALIVNNPNVKYFIGKVTMFTHFDIYARDLILYFLNLYFADKENLIHPKEAIVYRTEISELEKIFIGNSYQENSKILSKTVRERNEIFPPLINSYMNLSSSMRCFGTAINNDFGGVEETGIMITIKDIYDSKKKRHLEF